MPSVAAITSTTRNARRCQSGHGGSKKEIKPLNPNRNDYEDIENPNAYPGMSTTILYLI